MCRGVKTSTAADWLTTTETKEETKEETIRDVKETLQIMSIIYLTFFANIIN